MGRKEKVLSEICFTMSMTTVETKFSFLLIKFLLIFPGVKLVQWRD
jgi:hypothetical protein